MYEIIFSEESLDDISQIKRFISLDNELISEKVIASIINTIQYLLLFPKLWKVKNNNDREIIDSVYKYNIRYIIENNYIYIITIYKYQNK